MSFQPSSRSIALPQVLIVDDDAAVLDVARSMARAVGWHALVCDHPGQAVELFREHAERIHAVLVDLQPGGLEVENLHLGDFAELANVKIEERPVTDWDYGEVLRRQEYKDDRYLAAIDLQAWHGGNINLFYVVRAVTPGDYIVPPPFVEDMYRPQVRGQGEAVMGRLVVE